MPATDNSNENDKIVLTGKDLDWYRKVQKQAWTDDIYFSARRRMYGGIIAVLSFVGLASAGAVWGLYKTVMDWVESELKEQVTRDAGNAINAKVVELAPGIQARLDKRFSVLIIKSETKINKYTDRVTASIDEREAEFDTKFGKLEVRINRLDYDLDGNVTEAVRISKKEHDEVGTKSEITLAPVADCDPENLSDKLKAQIAISQDVKPTDRTASNNRAYFNNVFKLAVLENPNAPAKDQRPETRRLAECILSSVKKVVYKVSEKWFNPAEFARYKKETDFSFAMRVWGSTPVNTVVHLINDQPPLTRKARFQAIKTPPGKPNYYIQ